MKTRIKGYCKTLIRKCYKNPRPALDNLDRKLEKYINYSGGFFIEVGANDGYSQSKTYFLEKKRGWRGILIEGIPCLSDKCKKERTKSIVYNCALVSNDFLHSTVTMHYAHLMSLVDGALFRGEKDQQKRIKAGLQVQRIDDTYSIEVPARTLESILDENENLPEIDFFSLAVEGFELQVLKGLNMSKYTPKYILVGPLSFDEVNSFLLGHYDFVGQLSRRDYLYKVKENTL